MNPATAAKVYTFWEPKDGRLPYLELCRRTWSALPSDLEVVEIDYASLADHVADDAFDVTRLKKLPLHVQKDAIQIAVLRRHGGIFMDMDTIVLGDVAPVVRLLERSEVVMFDTHLAFVAARPGSRVLEAWHEGILRRLHTLDDRRAPNAPWDTLGNAILAEVMATLLRAPGLALSPRLVVARGARVLNRAARGARGTLGTLLGRAESRATKLAFAHAYGDLLAMASRRRFIAESDFRVGFWSSPFRDYLDFWFSENVTLERVLRRGQALVGLHNSWTPDWYKKLDEEQVLAHPCLLSRLLRHLLRATPGPLARPDR